MEKNDYSELAVKLISISNDLETIRRNVNGLLCSLTNRIIRENEEFKNPIQVVDYDDKGNICA